MKRKLILCLSFLAGFLTLAVNKPAAAAEETYKIGTDITFAPFEFQNEQNEYVGIDIDLLKAIAKDQDFKIELKPLGFDSSIQGVQSNQLDGMIAGMSITDERKKSFDFSDPYYDSGIQMAVAKGDTKIKNYADLKGKTVGAKVGTESATFLEENKEKYDYSIKLYDAADALYGSLNNNTVQAIFDDEPVLGYAVRKGQPLQLVGDKEKGNSYGFAVKKGKNAELLKKFNAGLKDLKSSGDYDKIVAKYVAKSEDTAATPMKKIEPKKAEYVIASDTAFAPFEFQNTDNKYEGIDVDLLNKAAQMQGFKLKWNHIGFAGAVQAVQGNQADAMIAGMTITDERKQSFDFSEPYFESGIQLAIKKGNDEIKSYADLKGKKVGAKIGTESADFLQKNKDKYGYTIKQYDTADGLYDSVRGGQIDAIMDDYPVIGYAISQGQELATPIKRESGGSYGFAVKKGQSPELLEMFNEALKEMKQTGEYDKILNKYIADGNEQKKSTVDESTIGGLLKNNWKVLLEGLWKTISLALISFVLALAIGVIFGLFSVAPIKGLRIFASIYVDIIRGIPMMVLAFFIFFGLSDAIGFTIPDYTAGVITLTLNASAYIAEIVRGGINAVPVGQMEASRSLGLGYTHTMRKIILPQAIKIMIPSFVNQFVISLKDTTIISVIGVVELLQTGKIIVARNMQSTYVYLIIGVMYLIVITALTRLAKVLEKKVK